MKTISSSSNPKFRYWKDLLSGSGLKKSTDFLLMGQRLVIEFLQQHPQSIREILVNNSEQIHLLPLTDRHSVTLLNSELFSQLDVFGTHFPLLVIEQPKIITWKPDVPAKNLEVFSALGDPANLGALLRVCEAFKISRVILLKESAHPFHPKSVRSSSGSCYRVPLTWGPSITDDLGEIWALDKSGQSINEFQWSPSGRLLFGEEGRGLPPQKKGLHCLSIPMAKGIDSLNAVSAASIALFHYRLQHPLTS